MHLIDANPPASGDQAFTKVAAFSGQGGQLVLTFDVGSNTTTLNADVDGDKVTDLVILFTGNVSSTAGWIL